MFYVVLIYVIDVEFTLYIIILIYSHSYSIVYMQ